MAWEIARMDVPDVFFADAGGVSIAWQQFGQVPTFWLYRAW
jgi:hypothetical protein